MPSKRFYDRHNKIHGWGFSQAKLSNWEYYWKSFKRGRKEYTFDRTKIYKSFDDAYDINDPHTFPVFHKNVWYRAYLSTNQYRILFTGMVITLFVILLRFLFSVKNSETKNIVVTKSLGEGFTFKRT